MLAAEQEIAKVCMYVSMSDSYFYTLSLIHPDEEWKLRPHLEVIHIAIGVRALMHACMYISVCMCCLCMQ